MNTIILALFTGGLANGGSPYTVDAELDGTLTAGAWGIALLAGAISSDLPAGPQCKVRLDSGVCDPSVLNRLDRSVLHDPSEDWIWVSDLGLYGGLSLPFAMSGIEALRTEQENAWRGFARDSLVIGQALGVTAALTALTKAAFRRSRPSHYRIGSDLSQVQERYSFPSGHTSITAAGMTSLVTTFALRRPNSKWRYPMAAGAIGWTALTAYGRVAGGRHFYTDVLAGALLGATVGYAIPKLHERKDSPPAEPSPGAEFSPIVFTIQGAL